MTKIEAAACLTQMYADLVKDSSQKPNYAIAVAMAIMALKENKND